MTDVELGYRALTIQEAVLCCAQLLERLASLREPISPSQALAVAQKMRREVHEV